MINEMQVADIIGDYINSVTTTDELIALFENGIQELHNASRLDNMKGALSVLVREAPLNVLIDLHNAIPNVESITVEDIVQPTEEEVMASMFGVTVEEFKEMQSKIEAEDLGIENNDLD